ncbi:hypothetical protein PMES_02630 [Profundibacterium mesophilum KAUST100406-0324]|uniref:Uncharacterized protein n=1 Tax=Profundibacterium mesophilum KAUST100406-0324 TaxID=1037889 RepID=A0A921TCI3_9RHOB|nr:hypothetical protein PMES_02630 [Profundibacterium mesophilum KAUST100406-0324]
MEHPLHHANRRRGKRPAIRPGRSRAGPGALLLALAAQALNMAPAEAQERAAAPPPRVIECYCTDRRGARHDLGTRLCLKVDGRAYIAHCEMALNVPIWRDTGEACLSARRPAPAPQAFPRAPDASEAAPSSAWRAPG